MSTANVKLQNAIKKNSSVTLKIRGTVYEIRYDSARGIDYLYLNDQQLGQVKDVTRYGFKCTVPPTEYMQYISYSDCQLLAVQFAKP